MVKPENDHIDDLILIGLIIKPHRVHGEVKVKIITDFPSRFRKLKRVFLVSKDGDVKKITIDRAKLLDGFVLIKFNEINSVAEAKTLVGNEIAILKKECIKLPQDRYYTFDLIGLQVVLSNGELIGTLQDVELHPEQDLLIIQTIQGHKALVPFVKEIVPVVDLGGKKIILHNLPGLLDEV
jgi:16S rRNA processing protein RimM